ncbi:putative TIM-barrel fold metal-dependent hydrolase [Chryseobacterium sp. 52]|uniref:amidohydrolase family protein n=1 Tax=Chryseobacterium sp. 52 TaxID=2035213 RepID=UPI000C173CF0|nr:amidohydrolase family protein [Chryseobacterium sp. 52]PIF46258.1 putative TIM-barrel fold metal-dependent hydrolase [Chryseobacterium sp. 52]
MDINFFLKTAREQISDNPSDRLTEKARVALQNKNCLIDVHTHIFDRKCITIGYLLLKMGTSRLKDIFSFESFSDEDPLLNKEEEEIYQLMKTNQLDSDDKWQQVEREMGKVVEITDSSEFLNNKIKDAFDVVFRKDSMLEILDFYISNFSINTLDEYKVHPMVLGVLMMDLETGWGKTPKKRYYEQVNEIKEIAKKRPILPFFAIDPRRAELTDPDENLYSLFLNAFTDPDTPFYGVKCYPSLGYLPGDDRLDPIFKICSEKNIPVLTHCGGESVSTFDHHIKVKENGVYKDFKIPGDSRASRARFLNDPDHWIPVLEKYNTMKLNLAHFSGNSDWEEYDKKGSQTRIEKIKKMMTNSSWDVYADFSYNVADMKTFNRFQKELDTNSEIKEKVMFGTDYWVVIPAADLLEMQKQFCLQMSDHFDDLLRKVPRRYLSIQP